VLIRPEGECAFRRLAPAVVLTLRRRGTRIWPRDPMLRIEASRLRLGGFWPRGQAVLNVVRPRLSLGTKGRREHTADTAMGFLRSLYRQPSRRQQAFNDEIEAEARIENLCVCLRLGQSVISSLERDGQAVPSPFGGGRTDSGAASWLLRSLLIHATTATS
jgi:hypothetical protein